MAEGRNRSYYLIFTLCFLLFGATVAVITSVVNFNLQYTDIQKAVERRAAEEMRHKSELAAGFVAAAEQQVAAISENAILSRYFENPIEANRRELNHLLLAQATADRRVMQLRVLDLKGMELARVDRKVLGGRATVREAKLLQDKSDRYYVLETQKLMGGLFWHSKIDLNVEFGEIEVPHKPTFRVSTLVVRSNQAVGMVIVNLHIGALLRQLVSSPDFNVLLIDREGEYIYHHLRQRAFSRYLQGVNLLEEYPGMARSIRAGVPSKEGEYFALEMSKYFKNGEQPRLVLIPRNEMIKQFRANNLSNAGLIALTVILVSVPLSYLISVIPVRLQRRLQTTLAQLQHFHRTIDRHVLTATLAPDGKVTETSRALSASLGLSQKALVGRRLGELVEAEGAEAVGQFEDLEPGAVWRGQVPFSRRDEQTLWLELTIAAPTEDEGRLTLMAEDITDKRRIEELSITDPLTGAFNRNKLTQVFEVELARAERYGHALSVVMMDIDFFKRINDTFGHQVGDQVLITSVLAMKGELRKTDILGRWGGEEFLVICPETETNGARLLAEKLRGKLESLVHPVAGKVTASLGVTSLKSGENEDQMVARCDQALYEAKHNGRNRVEVL